MAVIVPYGDPDAHGSICDSLSFRRSRGKVVLQKKPRVKQPNTPAQQQQKGWFKNTWNDWYTLGAGQLKTAKTKADEEDTFPANYYFAGHKETQEGNQVDLHFIKSCSTIHIDNTVGSTPGHIEIQLNTVQTPPLTGIYPVQRITDNQNVPLGGSVVAPYQAWFFLFINQSATIPVTIPEGYSLTFTYTKFDDVVETVTIKFHEMPLATGQRRDIYADNVWALYDAWPLTDPPVYTNPEAWPPST